MKASNVLEGLASKESKKILIFKLIAVFSKKSCMLPNTANFIALTLRVIPTAVNEVCLKCKGNIPPKSKRVLINCFCSTCKSTMRKNDQ